MSQFHGPYSRAGFEKFLFLHSEFLDQYCKVSDCKIFDTCLRCRPRSRHAWINVALEIAC